MDAYNGQHGNGAQHPMADVVMWDEPRRRAMQKYGSVYAHFIDNQDVTHWTKLPAV